MRRLAACVALSVWFVAPMAGEPMKAGDRQRLLAHLEMTESWLVSELSGLSSAQLTYRMTPESWSITDVTEHLAIAEPQYWQRVNDSMKQPRDDGQDRSDRRRHPLVRHRPDEPPEDRRGARPARHVQERRRGARRLPQAAINHARVRAGDERRPQVAQAPRRQHGRLSVVPDDLDALAAPHPADSRGQGARRLSEGVETREGRPGPQTTDSRVEKCQPQSAASSEGIPDRRRPELHLLDIGPAVCCLGRAGAIRCSKRTFSIHHRTAEILSKIHPRSRDSDRPIGQPIGYRSKFWPVFA